MPTFENHLNHVTFVMHDKADYGKNAGYPLITLMPLVNLEMFVKVFKL